MPIELAPEDVAAGDYVQQGDSWHRVIRNHGPVYVGPAQTNVKLEFACGFWYPVRGKPVTVTFSPDSHC